MTKFYAKVKVTFYTTVRIDVPDNATDEEEDKAARIEAFNLMEPFWDQIDDHEIEVLELDYD